MAKKFRPKTGKDSPFTQATMWSSRRQALDWMKGLITTQGNLALFDIKQQGKYWAVFAQQKKRKIRPAGPLVGRKFGKK